MTTGAGAIAHQPLADALPTLVLLCLDLERDAPEVRLAEVSSWLSDHLEGVEVLPVPDLCRNPDSVGDALRQASPQRLVIGLCSGDFPEIEVHAQVRKAGLDPLGIQAVNLGGYLEEGSSPSSIGARAEVLLAAAVARARAFPGSQPENLKASLASSQQRVSRRALFTLPPVSYISVPTFNRSLCARREGCDQCVSACPYGALSKDADTILVSRAQCQGCGLCVEICPHRAMDLPGWSPEELEAQLSSLLTCEADLGARPIAFVCRDATTPVGPGWLPVAVPCVSAVPVAAILAALAGGSGAVSLHSCGEDCSAGLDETVAGRVDYCRRLLRMLGEPQASERVTIVTATDGRSQPPPDLGPLPGHPPKGLATFFGRGAAARAVSDLATRYGAEDLTLDHRYSPLGRVVIDGQVCTGCATCAVGCPTRALSYESHDSVMNVAFDAALCTACGQCDPLCPERESGAIRVHRTTDVRLLSRGPQVVFQGQEVRCERCGGPVATRRMLDRIAGILGDDYHPQHMERLCAGCRGI